MNTLSVVIPTYNEERIVRKTLRAVFGYLSSQGRSIGIGDFEVIVVDDGSTDDTANLVRRFQAEKGFSSLKLLRFRQNQGKGWAVKKGMLAACGDLRLMCDADLSTPIEELERFVRVMRETRAEIVIGSKALKRSWVRKPQPWYREILGRVFNFWVRRIFTPGIVDTQRGFKLFTARAAEDLFSRQTVKGWVFDVEILYLARKLGYKVAEMPVPWEDRGESRVKVGRDLAGTVRDLFLIWYRHR